MFWLNHIMSRCFNNECPNIVRVAGKMHIGCMHCFAAREPIMRQLDPHGSPKLQVFMRQQAASSGFLDFQVGLHACMYACAKGHVRRCGCYRMRRSFAWLAQDAVVTAIFDRCRYMLHAHTVVPSWPCCPGVGHPRRVPGSWGSIEAPRACGRPESCGLYQRCGAQCPLRWCRHRRASF